MADFDRNGPVCWHWTWTNEFGETIKIGNVLWPLVIINDKQGSEFITLSGFDKRRTTGAMVSESWWNWLIRLLPVDHSSWKEGTRGDSGYCHLVIYIFIYFTNEYSFVMFSETMQWDNWQRGEWCQAGGVIFGIGGRSVAILYLDYVHGDPKVIPKWSLGLGGGRLQFCT